MANGSQTVSQTGSQTDLKVFSVRIVTLDYYMAPPISGIDICYSSFQGGKVNEVPVIRVYGSTPGGQKTCLHVHQALPYFYIPCADIPVDWEKEGDAYTHSISLALEKALKPCKGEKILWLPCLRRTIPEDISGGAVLDKSLQPHESHIPFILQFLVDYNLYGMGLLHLSKMKFRYPVPDTFCPKKSYHQYGIDKLVGTPSVSQADPSSDVCLGFPIWVSSKIPGGWMWQSEHFSEPSGQDLHHVKRQSICELEGDTIVDDILNQQFKMYTSLSQTHSDVKMVQSLIPIWEEEYERTGNCEMAMLADPEKPLAENVLKSLSLGLGYENKLIELCSQEEDFSSPEKKIDVTPPMNEKIVAVPFKGKDVCLTPLFAGGPSSEKIEKMDQKAADIEVAGLLRWLATSEAAEDINSEDELVRETILSPLMPARTIDKVLEKANMDYENESQKECQDILDSVQELEGSKEEELQSMDYSHFPQTSSDKRIPQLDGSNDDGSDENLSKSETRIGSKRTSQFEGNSRIGASSKHRRKKKLWGPLPFSAPRKVNADLEIDSVRRPDTCPGKIEEFPNVSFLAGNDLEKNCKDSKKNKDLDCFDLNGASSLVGCSLRDLMRKKRCYRVDPPGTENVPNFESSLTNIQTEAHKPRALTPVYSECFTEIGPNKELSCPLNATNQDSALYGDHCETYKSNEQESFRTQKETTSSTKYALLPVHLSKFCTETNSSPVEKMKQVEAPVSSCLSSDCVEPNVQLCIGGVGAAPKQDVNSTGNQERNNVMDMVVPMTVDVEAKNADSIGMTFHVKPPPADWTCASYHPSLIHEDMCEGMLGRDPDGEILPFFVEDFHEEEKAQSKCQTPFHQEAALGIPTHYQSDVSCLYLLTPALSPPTLDCVNQWLSHDNEGISGEVNAASKEPLSPSGICNSVIGSQSLPNNCQKTLIESGTESHMMPIPNQVCETEGICDAKIRSDDNIAKVNVYADHLQGISQISGPDGKLDPTPLSQIGFRDPASVGAGQQLSLLSIEVQAESRGDLNPDPRFDAINVIALAIQNDNDSIIGIYVILRGSCESDKRGVDGLSNCKVFVCYEEKNLFSLFRKIVCSIDPDMLMGWDIQCGSLGYLSERAAHLGIGLLNSISRTPTDTKFATMDSEISEKTNLENIIPESLIPDSVLMNDSIIEDEWGRTHASGVHVSGRIVLNVWRLMRGEVKLNMYSMEAVAEAVLRRKVPSIRDKVLAKWFSSGPGRARFRCIEYVTARAKMNLEIMNQLDMISRTSELARVFGIEFFAVLSRGSQYRVESMLLRLAHTQNYLAISPGSQQVAAQPAMECLPLVMEPESGFYADPVVVLDFQSLYPSMIIGYNLCFSTCLGKAVPARANSLGVSSYTPDQNALRDLTNQLLVTPNGVMYVAAKVRKGVLPRLLEEILSTRIMVKKALKSLAPSQQVLQRIFNARQLALKLIANVTYGYTAAGFSGRMPCAEIADSIVQCGRSTLERAISFVNANDKWKARVIYGDTDSLFVLLKGRSVKEALEIGQDIASQITAMNPNPVTLKMEKVYHPCFLLTKKRYVGYSYESPDQTEPLFDAKGIETVRRDTCGAVSKTMEKSLRLFFEQQNLSEVKAYLHRQWTRIISGRISLKDFIFAKEVRLGTYSSNKLSSLPPAAIVATKAMKLDPRAEPRYGERVPYVVIHGEPGARLSDMIVDPLDILAIDSPYRLNDTYYINKQIIPALQRAFGLVGADLNQWFIDMPRPAREGSSKRPLLGCNNAQRTRIDFYYLSKHCIVCGELVQGSSSDICSICQRREDVVAMAIVGRTSKLEKEIQHLAAVCRHCGGGDWLVETGVKCTSLACSVFYERRKVQKELKSLSTVAEDKGLYPKCTVEWF
ncbi:hypothetical protein ACFE04_002490 [Oxalis oulophora]